MYGTWQLNARDFDDFAARAVDVIGGTGERLRRRDAVGGRGREAAPKGREEEKRGGEVGEGCQEERPRKMRDVGNDRDVEDGGGGGAEWRSRTRLHEGHW